MAASGTVTVTSNATPTNTASTIVSRDASGNLSAGTLMLSGNLALPITTSSSSGVLTLGGLPFLHNFPGTALSDSTFVGASAGNMTMTGVANSAFGAQALTANTTGLQNSVVGADALYSNATGNNNMAFGYQALYANSTGSYNTAVGTYALNHNVASGNNPVGPFKIVSADVCQSRITS